MRDINTVRKAVATMANQLHKLGYSLSQAFRTAWKRVKILRNAGWPALLMRSSCYSL